MRKLSLVLLTLGTVVLCATDGMAAMRYITIGTGAVTGLYFPTGGTISGMINAKRDQYQLRASVDPTPGSVDNVNALVRGEIELGLVQSDHQHNAVNGLAEWQGTPQTKLRSVFALYPEAVTIVAAVDSGIKTLADLKGKVVSIGNPGSGTRPNSLLVLKAAGIDPEKDIQAEGFTADKAVEMMEQGRIDAFFYTVGHPNATTKNAVLGERRARFVPIDAAIIQTLTGGSPYFTRATIPVGSFYRTAENTEDVATFGVKATVCTSVDAPEPVVYAATKEVFDHLDAFKKLHPAYRGLTKQGMLEGLTAPLHPGAEKYLREAGLLK